MSKVVYKARYFTLEKQNVDCMTEKLNILRDKGDYLLGD